MTIRHKIGVPTEIPELYSTNLRFESDRKLLSQGLSSTPNAAAGVTAVKQIRGFQHEVLTLVGTEIEIDEANDYGSVKLLDFPTSNIIILGAMVDLTCTVDGVVIADPEDIDWAIGTVALTSTDFSNAGEKNIVTEADVAALGVMEAATATAEANVSLAKGANDLFLNIQATIGTTATQSFAGQIDLFFIDLGAQA